MQSHTSRFPALSLVKSSSDFLVMGEWSGSIHKL
jgi:hypothetical protein